MLSVAVMEKVQCWHS